MEKIFILDALRTPLGNFGGAFKNISSFELGATLIKELKARNNIEAGKFDGVVMGDVLQAGQVESASAELKDRLAPVLTTDSLMRCGEVSNYATDSLVRRATALQDTADGKNRRVVVINSSTANKAGLGEASKVQVTQDGQVVELELSIEEGMADNSVWVPLIPELGALNSEVQIKALS